MEVLEILVIADKLLLMDLLNFIQNYLIETESEWLHSYIMKIYQIAISYDSCSKLKDSVLNAICNDPKLIFQSSDFLTINESLLLPILECPLENAKISRVSKSDYAINIKDESYGPCFGDKDLWMRGNFNQPKSCSAQKDDYKTLITKYHNEFAISEYEVFEIFKT
ncbi:28431_t:CDS:2 [Gigaspora margarita]|uniref:28431_t:CDS:1 n=1 Tax=Gigaspora margarita TaxID=4874 RepID=A0ABN7V9S0_GIGMA|nr:28431_t:CDS:2 [Gigaspora margarita]